MLFTEDNLRLYSVTGIFVIEYCLYKLWTSWGLESSLVLGHCFGEYTAAVAAQGLFLPTALQLLSSFRAGFLAKAESGSMLVLPVGEFQTNKLIFQFLT